MIHDKMSIFVFLQTEHVLGLEVGARFVGVFYKTCARFTQNTRTRQDYTIGTPPKCNLDCCNVCKNVTIFVIGG